MKTIFYTCATLLLAAMLFSCEETITNTDPALKETIVNQQGILLKSIIIGTGDVSDSGRAATPVPVIEIIDSINVVAENEYDTKTHRLVVDQSYLRLHKLQPRSNDEMIPIRDGIIIWKNKNKYCISHK